MTSHARVVAGASLLTLAMAGVATAQLAPLPLPRTSAEAVTKAAGEEKEKKPGATEAAEPASDAQRLAAIRALIVSEPTSLRVMPRSLADACDRLQIQRGTGDSSELAPFLESVVADGSVDGYLEAIGLPPTGKNERGPLWLIGTCASVYVSIAAEHVTLKSEALNERLVQAQLAVHRASAWRSRLAERPSDGVQASRALADVQRAKRGIDELMRVNGLRSLLSAAVFGAATLSTNGIVLPKASGVDPDAITVSESDSSLPATLIKVESTHFGWEGERHIDWGLRAAFGFRPVDTLMVISQKVDPREPTANPKNPVVALMGRQSLYSAFGLRAGVFTRQNIEFSLMSQAIVSRLTSDKVLADPERSETLVAGPMPGARRTAWGWEMGAEMAFFDRDLRVIHAERGTVTPAVSVAGGFRFDRRFAAVDSGGELELVAPGRRLYLRVVLDALKVLDARSGGEKPKTFDFGIGVEHDRPWLRANGQQIPSVTRWFIRGDINILSAKK